MLARASPQQQLTQLFLGGLVDIVGLVPVVLIIAWETVSRVKRGCADEQDHHLGGRRVDREHHGQDGELEYQEGVHCT